MPTWNGNDLRDLLRPEDEGDADALMALIACAIPVVVFVVAFMVWVLETLF